MFYIKKKITYIIGYKNINAIKNFVINICTFFYIRRLFYNKNKDLEYNEKILSKIGLNYKKIIKNLNLIKINYLSSNLSWHYHIFSGLKTNKRKILEIGTYEGEFTNFLSKISPNSKIVTIDLKKTDSDFKRSYNRSVNNNLKKHLKIRSKNIKKKNIIFYELNSFNLLNKFKNKKFDIIWIDGDHINPQVSFDIFSSIRLLKKGGILLCDDVIKRKIKNALISDDSFQTLEYLEKIKVLKNFYFIKRLNAKNLLLKKFISYSIKI